MNFNIQEISLKVIKNITSTDFNNLLETRLQFIKEAQEYDKFSKIRLQDFNKFEKVIRNIWLFDFYIIIKYHYDKKLLIRSSLDVSNFLLECTPIKKVYFEEILNIKTFFASPDKVLSKVNKFLKTFGITKKYQCAVCGKNANKYCTKCTYVAYCSKECQKKNYKNHKKLCVQIDKTKNNNLPRLLPKFYKFYTFLKNNIGID